MPHIRTFNIICFLKTYIFVNWYCSFHSILVCAILPFAFGQLTHFYRLHLMVIFCVRSAAATRSGGVATFCVGSVSVSFYFGFRFPKNVLKRYVLYSAVSCDTYFHYAVLSTNIIEVADYQSCGNSYIYSIAQETTTRVYRK